MVEPITWSWRKKIRVSSASSTFGPDVVPQMTILPPGRSARIECDQVARPTVSMTASTRRGSRSPVSRTWWAPSSSARARLPSSRLVANTVSPPARASAISAVATPPPAPWTSTVSPALSPPCVKSIRYAVSHAVGRQAASSNDSDAGLGTTLDRGTATRSANVPWWRSDSSDRFGSSVSSPVQSGPLMTAWTTTSRAVLVDPGRVAAQDHRQRLLAQPDPAQRPQVVVVERGGPHGDGRPAVGHLRLGALAEHQAGQRVVGRELLGVHGEHVTTLAGLCGAEPGVGREVEQGRDRACEVATARRDQLAAADQARATPSRRAASDTAPETAGPTRSSNGDGTM